MWWKKHKWKIIVPVLAVAVLAAAFWYGGSAPGHQGWAVEKESDQSIASVSPGNLNSPDAETPSASTDADSQTLTPVPIGTKAQSDVPEAPEDIPAETPIEESASESESESGDESEAEDETEVDESESEEEAAADKEQGPEEEEKTGLESRPGGLEGDMTAQEKIDAAKKLADGSSPEVSEGNTDYSREQGMDIDSATGKDRYLTKPVPEGRPIPFEPQNAAISDTVYTCTLTVRCETILDKITWLDPEKVELVPKDGVIFATTTVTFYEGESVFNILQREMKKAKIHMEFMNTPMYNSAYIEGINNLYEFDCGELSGWMYKVNDWFPNYGCSRYQLKDGDVVEWVYTCNLGIDVGGSYAVGN